MTRLPVRVNKIKELLPHRYPFLMVDRVIELEENRIVAIKNVTSNEDFFNGHFDFSPIMPGVLQIEALVQTAGLHAPLYDPESYKASKEKVGVFSKVDRCSFEMPVTPGDQLRLEATITNIEKDKKGEPKRIQAHGEASVHGKVSCRLDMEFAMVPAKLISR